MCQAKSGLDICPFTTAIQIFVDNQVLREGVFLTGLPVVSLLSFTFMNLDGQRFDDGHR